MGAVANRILIDLAPLRERPGFRLLFAASLVEVFGSQFTAVAGRPRRRWEPWPTGS